MSDAHDIGGLTPVPRLLIVEPERAYLAVLARRLSEQNYRVVVADCSRTAIAELYRSAPDLILTELKGRNFHCGELIDVVRSDVVHRDIPILVLNGRSSAPESTRIIRHGADAVVHKPFHFEFLAARIEREVQRKRAYDELRRTNAALDGRIVERAIAIGELKQRIVELSAAQLGVAHAAKSGR